MVIDLGRRYGLKVSPPVAARIADGCGNDQAIVAQELQKLALYLDASPQSPKELDHDAVDAVGADMRRGRFPAARRPGAGGRDGRACRRAGAAAAGGTEAIPVIRALQRRLLMLAPLRARVERGERSTPS